MQLFVNLASSKIRHSARRAQVRISLQLPSHVSYWSIPTLWPNVGAWRLEKVSDSGKPESSVYPDLVPLESHPGMTAWPEGMAPGY